MLHHYNVLNLSQMLSESITPNKLNSSVTKKLVGTLVKIIFNSDSAEFRPNATIEIFVSGLVNYSF